MYVSGDIRSREKDQKPFINASVNAHGSFSNLVELWPPTLLISDVHHGVLHRKAGNYP